MHDPSLHGRIRKIAPIAMASVFVALIAIGLLGSRAFGIPALLVRFLFMACMAMVLLSPKRSVLSRASENAFLRFLGKYSYGMYVVQLPLVVLIPIASVTGQLPSSPIVQGAVYVAFMFGLITMVAFLSYHLFESHFLRLKHWFQEEDKPKERVEHE
jgi:peptidoglycan/LPS O-acetylase OafA/YrhL